LNSDDALESFKKSIPSAGAASFLQTGMQSHNGARLRAAAQALRTATQGGPLSLLATRMETRYHQPSVDLGPLKTSVTSMIENLQREQTDDNEAFKQCKANLASTKDEKESLDSTISSSVQKREKITNDIATLKEEMEVLQQEVTEIETSRTAAEAQRKSEKEEFTKVSSETTVSSNLLTKAKAILEKQFAPKGAALVQRSSSNWENSLSSFLSQEPAPELASAGSRGGAGAGVIGLLNTLLAELKGSAAAATKTEENAQADYDQMMEESSATREGARKNVVGKEAEVSRLQESANDLKVQHEMATDEHGAIVGKQQALHAECDFLLNTYEERKKARSAEEEALGNAIAILSGADFEGVQVQSSQSQFLQVSAERHIVSQ